MIGFDTDEIKSLLEVPDEQEPVLMTLETGKMVVDDQDSIVNLLENL